MRKPVLDHGYVEVKATMGTDAFLAECARMSTDTVGDDEKNVKLVERLIRDRHTSPIEFGQIVVEVAMPIFVMRQWVRHRTGAFNEFSARYSVMPDIYYMPSAERVQYQSTFNKQGSAESFAKDDAEHCRRIIEVNSQDSYSRYEAMVDMGLTRELARVVLPVNFYTKVRWTVNLHNLFHFLKLREDPHAQWEVQQYANAMHEVCREYFPVATKAFEHYIQNTVSMSSRSARSLLGAIGSDRLAELARETPELREFIHKHGVLSSE